MKSIFLTMALFLPSVSYAGVSVNGVSEGYIQETSNAIIVNGLRVNQNNSNQAALRIDNPNGKRVFVRNVRVTAVNPNYHSDEGLAAVVAIDAGDADLEVDNVDIDVRGDASIEASGTRGTSNVCASVYCSQRIGRTGRDVSERTRVTTHGRLDIKATKNR